jgi:hypothetical protein
MNAPLTNYTTEFRSIKDDVSPEEWQARLDLAACYRLVDAYGMTDIIYNHITLRIPGTDHLLINLYGLLYKEITAQAWYGSMPTAILSGSRTPTTASTAPAW